MKGAIKASQKKLQIMSKKINDIEYANKQKELNALQLKNPDLSAEEIKTLWDMKQLEAFQKKREKDIENQIFQDLINQDMKKQQQMKKNNGNK